MIEALLSAIAILTGPDVDLEATLADARAVAACESGVRLADGTAVLGSHDWTARNPTSSAAGGFQFVDRTWTWTLETAGIEPLWTSAGDAPTIVQTAAFVTLWDDRAGASHWAPSRSCWAPLLYVE